MSIESDADFLDRVDERLAEVMPPPEWADDLKRLAKLARLNVHANDTGWLIERYINSTAYYWNAGALNGNGDGFTTCADDAVRFARVEDAQTFLDHVCDSLGRVVENAWINSKT